MAHFLSRERTPTSPSPSPEPVEGGQNGQGGNGEVAQVGLNTMQEPLTSQNAGRFGGLGQINPGDPASSSSTIQSIVKPEEIARQVLEEKLRIGIDDLMQLAMCAGEVQPGDEDIVQMKVNETMDSLQAVQDACNVPELTQMVPEDVMGMIDQGRNPDIHTRTFTNRLNGDNQQMRGQAINLDQYRSRLRAKIEEAFPEMKAELEAIDSY